VSEARPPHELIGSSLREGRYAVTGMLGEGTQGATLEAVDKRNGQLVAVKRFQVRGARSWKEVELAEREAQVLSRLRHPLLPGAIEHFEEAGALYLVMDHIEGDTVSTLGSASLDEVLWFLHDAADVLEYLHGQTPPIIHRDIKPGNVIRRPAGDDETRPSYVLVDFGSVRNTLRLNGGSTMVGTFGYMAPEQLQGRATASTDIYAVGVTALRMLTGTEPEHLPHEGLDIDVRKALGKKASPDLVAALEAMVRTNPDERASSIAPLLAKLPRPGATHDVTSRRQPTGTRQARAEPSSARGEPTRRKQRKRDRRKQRKREQRKQRKRRTGRATADDSQESAALAILRPLVVVALSLSRLAVVIALVVVVPVVLSVLSIAFGPKLRKASKKVLAAAKRADQAIVRARRRVVSHPNARVRIDATRARVAPEPMEQHNEAAAERELAAAEEARAELERRRR